MKNIRQKELKRKNRQNSIVKIVLLFIATVIIFLIGSSLLDIDNAIRSQEEAIEKENDRLFILKERRRIMRENIKKSEELLPISTSVPPDMERMKRQGCVTDGLLSGYGDEKRNIKLINRLECYYLHRAVETWLKPPQWGVVIDIMSRITQSQIVYGMFIAEAINTKSQYWDSKNQEWFNFKDMCKPGTKEFWGYRTCVPTFDDKDYRRYVTQIMKEGIDNGVQVFLIGQIHMQDARHLDDTDVEDVLDTVRSYAHDKGVEILIGAQTNDALDKDYLRLFDFIEGGTGLHPDGNIEDGACFSRWDDWCWALLWHESYQEKAPDTFIHLDWSGVSNDDMATFVKMPKNQRKEVLETLHTFFNKKDIGFLLPVMTALPRNHNGCHGNQEWYYSPDKKYSCNDEKTINRILTKYR